MMRFSILAIAFLSGCGPHWRTPSSILTKCNGNHQCIEICTDYQDVQFGQLYCKQLQREQRARLEPKESADRARASVRILGVPEFPLSTSDIASRSMPAVVTIRTGNGFGTGFAVGNHGFVVTNYHIIAAQSSIAVEFDDRVEYISEIAAFSATLDLAILPVSGLKIALPMADRDHVELGDPVLAIGHPAGFTSSVAAGIVSSIRTNESNTEQFQTTLPMMAGSSGGPLLDRHGRVIGVIQAAALNMQPLTFAIPIGQVKPLLYKAVRAPDPIPIAEFARLTAPPEREVEFPPKPTPAPPVAPRVLQGCTRADRVLIADTAEETLHAGRHLCDVEPNLSCVYVYLGATLALEKHLSATCTGARAMLSNARTDAVKLTDAKTHEKALQALFESLRGGARDLQDGTPSDPK